MDIFASALSGFVMKLYDDLTENKIVTDGILKECIHSLSCFLLGATAMNDFTYTLLLYIVNLGTHYGNSDAFSADKEKSILYMYPIFFIITLPTIRQLSVFELLIAIIAIIISFNEGATIKEEVSFRKLTMRLAICGIILVMIPIGLYFTILSGSLLKLCLVGLFYLLTSCAYQSYELFFKNVEVKINDQFIKNITLSSKHIPITTNTTNT